MPNYNLKTVLGERILNKYVIHAQFAPEKFVELMQLMEHRYSCKDYVTSKGTSQNIHNEYTIYSGKDYVTIDARVILLWEPTLTESTPNTEDFMQRKRPSWPNSH